MQVNTTINKHTSCLPAAAAAADPTEPSQPASTPAPVLMEATAVQCGILSWRGQHYGQVLTLLLFVIAFPPRWLGTSHSRHPLETALRVVFSEIKHVSYLKGKRKFLIKHRSC